MTKKEIIETGRDVLGSKAGPSRPSAEPGRRVRPGRQPPLPDEDARHRHRHGQVRPRRPQARRHPGQLRHAGHLHPSRRGRPRRPGHDPQGGRRHRHLLQRRDAGDRRTSSISSSGSASSSSPSPETGTSKIAQYSDIVLDAARRQGSRAGQYHPDGFVDGRPRPRRRPGHRGHEEERLQRAGFRRRPPQGPGGAEAPPGRKR